MVNFPGSLDSLANPSSTTLRNAPGFELHTVVSTLNDIAEQLEAKVGISESPTPSDSPIGSTVLASDGAGRSGWRKVTTFDITDGTIATGDLAANAVSQIGSAVGSTSAPTTTSTTYVDLTEMSVTLTSVGGDLVVHFSGSFYISTGAPGNISVGLSLDGAAEVCERVYTGATNNNIGVIAMTHVFTGVSAANHTVKARWKTGAGTATAHLTQRTLVVKERKR